TLTFDHPSPGDVARFVLTSFQSDLGERAPSESERELSDQEIRRLLNQIPIRRLRSEGVLGTLLALAPRREDHDAFGPDLDALDEDALLTVAGTLLEGN